MKEFIKRSALIFNIALLSFQVMAQPEPKEFIVTGKVKNDSKGKR